jgi:hypothetical protein
MATEIGSVTARKAVHEDFHPSSGCNSRLQKKFGCAQRKRSKMSCIRFFVNSHELIVDRLEGTASECVRDTTPLMRREQDLLFQTRCYF